MTTLAHLSIYRARGRTPIPAPSNEDRRRAFERALIDIRPVQLDNYMRWPHQAAERRTARPNRDTP